VTVIKKNFSRLKSEVGQFRIRSSTLIIPQMNPLSSPLLAAIFESHGVPAHVPETYVGLDLGKAHTSGKECFPCQVTLGDILYFLQQEKNRLGNRFDPHTYVLFMPGADGPCRFGMYNKFQRIILDSFPEYREVRIASLSSQETYSVGNLIDKSRRRDFRKMGYAAVIVGDLLERLLWRVRPYERQHGSTDQFIQEAQQKMVKLFRQHARELQFKPLYEGLRLIFSEARDLIDPAIPQKPLIGMVGEIYLRTHVQANQHIIRQLEKHGGEVVNASIGEWINYTSYEKLLRVKRDFFYHLRRLDFQHIKSDLRGCLLYKADALYQQFRQKSLYRLATELVPIHQDHQIAPLDELLQKTGLLDFKIPGEAALSISGTLTYRNHGYDGVVNVYPFSCMPGTLSSSILKPWCHNHKFPFMDAPCDSSSQPGREAAIRTFLYQAQQHFERRGNGRHGSFSTNGPM
jgi:predicted nucleotide-binding protein (sugar kinase/HSP70/actin superfamily)